jgi:hypothetical protein
MDEWTVCKDSIFVVVEKFRNSIGSLQFGPVIECISGGFYSANILKKFVFFSSNKDESLYFLDGRSCVLCTDAINIICILETNLNNMSISTLRE